MVAQKIRIISRYFLMLVVFRFLFDRSVSNHVRKSGGSPPQKSRFCRASPDIGSASLFDGCEAHAQKNKKRASGAVEPLRDGFICSQTLAESGSEPREVKAPDCAGRYKCETEEKKRQDLCARCRIDELRKESEKEERDFRIQNIGQHALPKRSRSRAPAKIRWQTQLPASLK